MTLRDIFKFRDSPETETSKPFLEHLEDLRWTIVKMALTLACRDDYLFRVSLDTGAHYSGAAKDVGSQVGTLKALGITDSIVIRFIWRFMPASFSPFRCCCISSRNSFCRHSLRWRNGFYFQRSL